MIDIYHTSFDARLPDHLWNEAIDIMPASIAERIARYIRWQDRHCVLMGKLLLRYGYAKTIHQNSNDCDVKGVTDSNILEKLDESPHGRPVLKDKNVDFNISHSQTCIICGISNCAKIGLDIEKIRQIELTDFKKYMNEDEWSKIQNANDPHSGFFEYWTMKESVMKADGRGLSIPFDDIILSNAHADLYDTRWYFKTLDIDTGYKCHLATDIKNSRIRIESPSFSDLIV